MREIDLFPSEDFWESRSAQELELLFMAHSAVPIGKVHAYQADDLSRTSISIETGDIFSDRGLHEFYYNTSDGKRLEAGLDITTINRDPPSGRTQAMHCIYESNGFIGRKKLTYHITSDGCATWLIAETKPRPITGNTVLAMARAAFMAGEDYHRRLYPSLEP